jgi:hypothetical protein
MTEGKYPATAGTAAPLDDLMLAMDVVDTLLVLARERCALPVAGRGVFEADNVRSPGLSAHHDNGEGDLWFDERAGF